MDSRPYPPAPEWDRRSWPDGGRVDQFSAADEWPLRRYRLGSGARGHMLVMGGRGDMIEKFLEVIVHWAGLGWAVTSFDWRGQGGSGRLAADPLTGHIGDFNQWLDDLGGIAQAWERDAGPAPKAMIGHSMGAMAAVQNAMQAPARYRAAVPSVYGSSPCASSGLPLPGRQSSLSCSRYRP